MFKGHQLVKLKHYGWVFDLTDFKGYFVVLDESGEVKEYKHAFTIKSVGEKMKAEKFMRVPKHVFEDTLLEIKKYKREVDRLERDISGNS